MLFLGKPTEYWYELQRMVEEKGLNEERLLDENAFLRKQLGFYGRAVSDAYRILGQVMNETK